MQFNFTASYFIKSSFGFKGNLTPEKEAEIQRRAQVVKETFQNSLVEKRKMTLASVSKETGFTQAEVKTALKYDEALAALWRQQISMNKTIKEPNEDTLDKQIKVKVVLLNAKINNERLGLNEVAKRAGLTPDTVNYYIRKDKSLKSLWYWVKLRDQVSYTDDEKREQINLIEAQLKLAIKKKKAVTAGEIADATGLEKHIVDERIDADKKLSKLRKRTLDFSNQNYQTEITLIKQALEDAKEKGLKTTLVHISNTTGIPDSTVSKRIKENPDLEKLFNETRAQKHTVRAQDVISAQNAQIASVLNKALEDGEKLTIGVVVSRLEGMEANTVSARISSCPKLTVLWEKVKDGDKASLSKDAIKAQVKNIEQILMEVWENKQRISLKELAGRAQITQRMVSDRIQSSELLSVLWEITCKKLGFPHTDEAIEVQNVMLERVLNQRIHDKIKPAYYQLAQYLDLSEHIVKQRIETNPDLLALYDEAVRAA